MSDSMSDSCIDRSCSKWSSSLICCLIEWEMIEVSNYAHVELPPCITYVGSRLKQDVTSGWWVVAYSEYLARMGCSLFKRYKKFNLFGASPGGFVAICGSSTYPWY